MTPLHHIPLLSLTCFLESLNPLLKRIEDRLEISPTSKWSVERGPLDLNRPGFSELQYGGAPIKVTIWSPQSGPDITVFRAHSEDGWIHFVRKLTQKDGPDSISVRSTTPDERWGIQEVQYQKPGAYWPARILRHLEEENGYEFLQDGEPLPSEDLSISPQRRIATRSDVLLYVKGLGIDIEAPSFWKSDFDAVYLQEMRSG